MVYPLVTLDDGTEIVHSELLKDNTVKVYIETADAELGFRHATCYLPSVEWKDVYGYTEGDIKRFEDVIKREASNLIKKLKMAEVKIKVPEEMVPYIEPKTGDDYIIRNAMIMYPYIKKGVISHGRAAEIIGISKWDLITLYDNMGLPYLSSVSDYKEDLKTIDELLASEETNK